MLEEVRLGHTNAEIAARTGLSFNTVKTHIANMLVKTDTRDRQALAAWEGEPAEVSRHRLGRGFALPLAGWGMGAKVAGGVVAAAVFVGAVWLVFSELNVGGEEPAAASAWTFADGGLYMATTTEFTLSSLRTPPAGVPPGLDAGPQLDSDFREEWTLWWDGRDQWRAELVSTSSRVYGSEHRIVVGNSGVVSQYDVLRHTVSEISADEFWESYFVGWVRPILAPVVEADTIDEYYEWLAGHFDPSIRDVTRIHSGQTMHLGRTVEIIETAEDRTMIEPDTMFLVLQESPGFRYEVTEVETDRTLDPQLFVFNPPVDVGEIHRGGPAGRGCASGTGTVPVPGFLALSHSPDGWEHRMSGGVGRSTGPWGDHCDIWHVTEQFVPDDGDGYIWLEQVNLVHIPEHLRRGTPIDVVGHDGYRISTDDLEQLVWAQDGVVAMLESDVLPFEELLRIAESAELVP